MEFSINKSIEILERTPNVLIQFTRDLSDEWTNVNEGGETWSVYDVIGHLLEGEKTDLKSASLKTIQKSTLAFGGAL